jgi:hypothetical protein
MTERHEVETQAVLAAQSDFFTADESGHPTGEEQAAGKIQWLQD